MTYKHFGILGLLFLVISRILLSQGIHFAAFDLAHLLMLIGAVLTLSFSFVFHKSTLSAIATILSILGAIAHVGMCAIDMVFWSFGSDDAGRNELMGHLMGTPSIWLSFFVIGPSLLFIGLSLYAWDFVKKHTLIALLAIIGASCIGLGQLVWNSNLVVVAGYIGLALGLGILAFREGTFTKP